MRTDKIEEIIESIQQFTYGNVTIEQAAKEISELMEAYNRVAVEDVKDQIRVMLLDEDLEMLAERI